MIHRCDVRPEDLGPLLLGQLGPAEGRAVARQVAACPLCAQEAAALSQVVAALRACPPPEVQEEPPPSLERPASEALGQVLAEVHRERARRRRRAVAAAAAAGVVVTGGGLAAWQLDIPTGSDRRPSQAAVAVVLEGSAGTSGRATLADRRWGTAIRLRASGLDADASYGVWLARADGGRLPAGSFTPTSAGTVDLQLTTALPLPAGRVLGVTRLPAEGRQAPLDVLEGRLPS